MRTTKRTPLTEPTPVGRRIRKLRLAAKMSARQLSREAGATASVVGQIEGGLIREPSGTILNGIAGALGTTVEWLLTGEERQAS